MEESRPRNPFVKFLAEPGFVSLLLVNATLIALYMEDEQKASTIIFTYYLQSVFIGIFHFVRIMSLKSFEPGGMTVNGAPLQNTRKAKIGTGLFFAFHYGFFHFVYFIFLIGLLFEIPGRVDFFLTLGTVACFILSGVFELRAHKRQDRVKQPVMAFLFFQPYFRIIPMHIFILLAFNNFSPDNFIYFLLLKTLADSITYLVFTRRDGVVMPL